MHQGSGLHYLRRFFTGEEERKSASKEEKKHCSSWSDSSLGWEFETCLGGDGSPLGR